MVSLFEMDMVKKVLIINTTPNRGGAARVASEIFEFLRNKNEITAYFAYGRGPNLNDNRLFKFGFAFEVYLHAFLVRFLGIEGFGSYFSTRRLINFIKKEKFDLIHLHNVHGYYLNFFKVFDFFKKIQIPIVWTFHDEWPINALLAHSMGCVHCRTGMGRCFGQYSYPKTYNRLFLKSLLKRKQKAFSDLKNLSIVCPSESLAAEVEASYFEKNNIFVISNGVDINLFKPAKNKLELRERYKVPKNKKIVFFSVAKIKEKRKRVEFIIKTARALEDEDVLFLGAGKGDFKGGHNIISFGHVSDKKVMSDLYALSDLYIFLSLAEIMPLSVLEAMASGLPVITFDIPCVRELLKTGGGILVPQGDVSGLINGLKALVGDDNKRKEVGAIARERTVREFSLEKSLNEYFSLYNKALKNEGFNNYYCF